MYVCSFIVNAFNDRIILNESQTILPEFVHSFIYEMQGESPYKYLYAENYIIGNYQKFNNNAGWKIEVDSK